MIKKIKNSDLAYIAGVIDSDGCIGLMKNGKTGYWIRPRVAINQVQREAIDFIVERFGGNLNIVKQPEESNWRDLYKWMLYSQKRVKPFLEAILPHLKIKKRQAEEVIKFCDLRINSLKSYETRKYRKGNRYWSTRVSTYSEEETNLYNNVRSLNQVGKYA